MEPKFSALDDERGLEIVDPIENHRYVIYTDSEISPTSADTGGFAYPVTTACEITVSELEFPHSGYIEVRDADDGRHILEVGHKGTRRLDSDSYLLGIGAPIKLYLRVDSALTVTATPNKGRVTFDSRTRAIVGARSTGLSPSATITVPDDPRALMRAAATFGSAMKTATPERSWPTMQGHPPSIERGDTLSIPDSLEVPETGIRLRVPADYEHVFTVAPLAYYLGAEIVPGEPAQLLTESGFSHRLDSEDGFEAEVGRVLKQTLLFEWVTRTEGFKPVDLAQRRQVESSPEVEFDFERLYDEPLRERLAAYLSIPYETVEDAIPQWSRVTYMRPDPERAELLPFVVNHMSLIRIQSRSAAPSKSAVEGGTAVRSFKRLTESGSDELLTADPQVAGVPDVDEYVPLPDDNALERSWAGDGTPVSGAKLLPTAFDRERNEPTDGEIDVTVVCNDARMRDESNAVSEAYGQRNLVPFNIDSRFNVPTDELEALLAEDHDLFHFIGHVDGRGLQCPDGILDTRTVEETGAATVLLNACRSHDQGIALVEAGARAAVVSWADVDNRGAAEFGETLAGLLNYGFDVGTAVQIAEEYTSVGRHYVAVGNPYVTVAQCRDGIPLIVEFDRESLVPPAPEDTLSVSIQQYPVRSYTTGATIECYLHYGTHPTHHVVPSSRTYTDITGERLRRIYDDESYSAPLLVDGELKWSTEWFTGNLPDE